MKHNDVEKSFQQVTTVYVGDRMTPEFHLRNSSSNRSYLLESGFHSASLTSNEGSKNRLTNSAKFSISGNHSQGHGGSHSRVNVVKLGSKKRHVSATEFGSIERKKREPLSVTEMTVVSRKEHKSPHTPTPASGGSACFLAGNMIPRPYIPEKTEDTELLEAPPETVANVSFHIPDGEEKDDSCADDDVIEKDNTSSVLTKPLSCQTSPIDIPSRSTSNSSFSSRTSSRKPSTSSSSDSLSCLRDKSPPPLASIPSSPPKDLTPARPSVRERLWKWLLKSNTQSDSDRPTYFIGCKVF